MTKTINPENWVDDEITYTFQEGSLIINDEYFEVISSKEDDTISYRVPALGITAFDIIGEYEAFDDCDICSRIAKDPLDAIVKVIANIY